LFAALSEFAELLIHQNIIREGQEELDVTVRPLIDDIPFCEDLPPRLMKVPGEGRKDSRTKGQRAGDHNQNPSNPAHRVGGRRPLQVTGYLFFECILPHVHCIAGEGLWQRRDILEIQRANPTCTSSRSYSDVALVHVGLGEDDLVAAETHLEWSSVHHPESIREPDASPDY
jgi:hypothetical protein